MIRRIACHLKGHKIDPSESIVKEWIKDPRNYLCKCHRCGKYVMHDGAISRMTIVLNEEQAMSVKREIALGFEDIKRYEPPKGSE